MSKITLKDIISYIQGNIRYQLYYSKFNWLIRKHIREQIEFRINSMDRICFNQGSCIMCGCRTTHLQMANKMCDNPCYPAMVNKRIWEFWKSRPLHAMDINNVHIYWTLDLQFKKLIRLYEQLEN